MASAVHFLDAQDQFWTQIDWYFQKYSWLICQIYNHQRIEYQHCTSVLKWPRSVLDTYRLILNMYHFCCQFACPICCSGITLECLWLRTAVQVMEVRIQWTCLSRPCFDNLTVVSCPCLFDALLCFLVSEWVIHQHSTTPGSQSHLFHGTAVALNLTQSSLDVFIGSSWIEGPQQGALCVGQTL